MLETLNESGYTIIKSSKTNPTRVLQDLQSELWNIIISWLTDSNGISVIEPNIKKWEDSTGREWFTHNKNLAHIDWVTYPIIPKYIALMYVVLPSISCRNFIISINSILDRLSDTERAIIETQNAINIYNLKTEKPTNKFRPILENWVFAFRSEIIETQDISTEFGEVCDKIRRLLDQEDLKTYLSPKIWEVLIIDNHTQLHGREWFDWYRKVVRAVYW